MPGARCTRGLVCQMGRKGAHEHTGSAETLRHPPRNGFTAYFVLSPVSGVFATVIAWDLPRNLTPRSRRQDHTTSPYVLAISSGEKTRLTPRRPSHPLPNVRDDRETPLLWAGDGRTYALICTSGKANYFRIWGLTS